MKKKQKKSSGCKKGFTLIEVLVAMFIFSFMMVAVSDIFVSFVKSYRTARTTQKTLESAQFAMNYMAKTLRTSTLINVPEDGLSVVVYDYSQNKCIRYIFAEGGLRMNKANSLDDPDSIDENSCNGVFDTDEEEQLLANGSFVDDGNTKFVNLVHTDGAESNDPNDKVIGMVSVSMKIQPQGSAMPMFVQTSVSLRDFENAVDPSTGGITNPLAEEPEIDSFTLAATNPVSNKVGITFTASPQQEGVEITHYIISEGGITENPSPDDPSWSPWSSRPTSYTFSTGLPICGVSASKKLYAIVMDSNKSTSGSKDSNSVAVCQPDLDPPTITAFNDVPETSAELLVSGMDIVATDTPGSGVAACQITESATKPAATGGWTGCSGISHTFGTDGSFTLYPWAIDNAGNISSAVSESSGLRKNIIVDTHDPEVTTFVVPTTSYTFSIPINSFTATDSSGIAGYMITETATKPAASASEWSKTAPTTYPVSSEGNKTLYAWAKDNAGRVSASKSATVNVRNYIAVGACSISVYNTDMSGTKAWSDDSSYNDQHCATPYCSGDPGVLSSDNTVNFITHQSSWLLDSDKGYMARQACKDVGGRLPSITELQCIKANKSTLGTFSSGRYWSNAEEKKTAQGNCLTCSFGVPIFGVCLLGTCTSYETVYTYENAFGFDIMGTGGSAALSKSTLSRVRCVH